LDRRRQIDVEEQGQLGGDRGEATVAGAAGAADLAGIVDEPPGAQLAGRVERLEDGSRIGTALRSMATGGIRSSPTRA